MVFHTFFKCSPIIVQHTTKFTFLKVFRFIWYPSHSWNWLNSGDISIFKGFFHTFQLQHHLVVDFYKWKISFKLSYIVFGIFTYNFHAFWWSNLKKCLVALSRVRSLWKELTKILSVTGLPWQSWLKAKSNIFIPTFWRSILNILDFKQSGMMKIIRTVRALFQILA